MLSPLVSVKELPDIWEALLKRDSDELDTAFSDGGNLSLLMAATRRLCLDGFQDGDVPSQMAAHRMLNHIYKLFIYPPAQASGAQAAMVVSAVKAEIERHMIAREDSFISPQVYEQIPEDADEFVPFLEAYIKSHAAYGHPLYTQVLSNEADIEGLRTFFTQEISVDGSFSDFLILLMLGTSGSIRMEISKNYWDEMGNGKPEEVHTDLFMRAVRALKLEGEDLEKKASLGSLYCGNLSLALSLNRRYFSAATGYFAAMEYLVPHRFEHVLKAWERNGLQATDIEYHRLHIVIDVEHSRGWLDNVIKPLVKNDYRKSREVLRGVLFRLNSSARYLDALIQLMKPAS
jgi:pyrroloquinoline quinone (PQQ) biosynthesis protein C